MDDDAPGLGVGFSIETGASFENLARLDNQIDSVTAKAIDEFNRMERASAGALNLNGATMSVSAFGAAATRELATAARQMAQVERAGESMVRQLERQGAAFGKTREEMRSTKAEAAALAAEQRGLTELAGRIRAAEADLFGKEASAAQKARAETEALALARDEAARKAITDAEAVAQAMRQAAQGPAMFEAAAKRAWAAARELEAEQAKVERAMAQADAQHYAKGPTIFEAAAKRAAQAARELEQADAATARARQSTMAAADSYAAKLEGEAAAIGKTTAELREMEVAQRAAAAEAAGMPDQAARIREAGAAYARAQAQAEALAAEERALAQASHEAAEAARQAAAAQAAQDASLNSLRSSVDPLYGSQQRLSRELENAVRLYRAGAIGQDEYERSTQSLGERLDEVQRAQARAAEGAGDAAKGAKLGANDLTNIAFQIQDIIVSLQGGQKPLTVLLQQGSQLGGIMMQTGASAGDMARAILGITVVSRPTAAAAAALAEAQAAVGAAQTAATTAGTKAAVASAELAVAEEAAARAGAQDAVAQHALARAQTQAAASAEVAAAANRQLAAAETAAGTAASRASATAVRSLAPWLSTMVAFAAPIAVAGVALYRWEKQLGDDAGLKKYAASLGLTKAEMKKLGDQSVTTGDLVAGLWKTVQDGLDMKIDGKKIVDYLFSPDDAKQVQGFIASIYGFFAGGYDAIMALWDSMSATVTAYISEIAKKAAAFFAPVVSAAKWAGDMIGSIFNTVYGWVAGWFKSISGFLAPVLSAIGQGPAASAVEKAGGSLGKTFSEAYAKRVQGFISGSNAFVAKVGENAVDAAQKRLRKKANELIADRADKKPKVDRHAEQLAREAEATEAQIRNLYKLADAYGVSGAAALIAEARVKAESQAIKQRADIEAAVERQVRLAIAQRVSDAAKSTAALRDQAAAQATINTLVAGGLVPAERAAELVKDQIADLPLLAALQAATQIGNREAIDAATEALKRQRDARGDLKAAEVESAFQVDQAAARDQLAMLDAERRLIGATDAARAHELATLKATQEAKAKHYDPAQAADYVAEQVKIADATEANTRAQDDYNASLTAMGDLFDAIDQSAQTAAQGMSDAFGKAGSAIGDALTVMTGYYADQARLQEAHKAALVAAHGDQARIDRENRLYSLRSSSMQIAAFGDMAASAKGFFKEGSAGYAALGAAEKAFRAVQFAMSVRAIAQDVIETGSSLANSAARTAANAVEAVTKAISSLPFPANIAAGAATIAALAAIGVSIAGGFGGGKNSLAKPNDGTGTVLGDPAAKSDSIKNAIEQLRQVDLITNSYSRQMAASLRSIDNQIGGVAALVVRAGDVNASADVAQGFKTNAVGSVLKAIVPVFGGALASLFGAKTTVVGSGLYGGAQSLGSILDGGFDASYYSDVQKKKKLFGITTGTKYSTQLTGADAQLENQFTLILRGFSDAIAAAAGPLGNSTGEIEQRLRGFVVDIGKIDLKDLTGEQIQEKLSAVFGAAADKMALAAFPGFEGLQKVGEGAFETLVRVATTVEQVTTALDQLGAGARSLSVDAKLGLADQFDSVSDMASAIDGYFQAFYSAEEQAAAKTRQLTGAFGSLGLTMPTSIAAFRQLVDAQDLTTSAGQSTYAMLLKLAPAFAELQSVLTGTKSAADIASERQGLERQLLELRGDTAAIRALDLAKLDASNRALQQQLWAMQDGQAAAKAADELRQAWTSVGDSIMDEVRRIRGLTDTAGAGGSFATLLGQFNAANAAARGGDMDVAKTLPGLSQALLSAAADAATSRQELDRVRAQTAASLKQTNAVIAALASTSATSTASSNAALLAAAATTQAATTPVPAANDDQAAELRAIREELVQLRKENTQGHAENANANKRTASVLEDVTNLSGGQAISVASAA